MKKIARNSFLSTIGSLCVFLFTNMPVKGQDNVKLVASFPDDVDKIVSASCTPCHTDKGIFKAKSRLNFNSWEQYTPKKQKNRARKMFNELDKGKMPPKSAREKHPERIPTPEQVAVIKHWSETILSESK